MKKFFMLLLIANLLVLTLSGCGYSFQKGDTINNETADPAGTDEPGCQDTQKILKGNVFYPEAAQGLFAKYREFGFQWKVSYDSFLEEWSVHYLYEGTEEVNGQATEVYTVTFAETGEEIVEKHWYNPQWDYIKGVINGQEVERGNVHLPTQIHSYVGMVLDSRTVFDSDGCIDPLVYKLDQGASGTQGSPLGTMEVYVLRRVTDNEIRTYGVNEIDGELIFTLIRFGEAGTDYLEELQITHLVAR